MANTQSGAAAELVEGRAIAQSHEAQHAARRRLSIILLGGGGQKGIRDVQWQATLLYNQSVQLRLVSRRLAIALLQAAPWRSYERDAAIGQCKMVLPFR